MASAIDTFIAKVIKREGGYVNNPADRGGPTKYGITYATLAEWRGVNTTVEDVQNLTEEEAANIYRDNYFKGLEDVTDPKVLEFLFDFAVNSGPGNAVKALQTVIHTAPDGSFGPNSKAALKKYGAQANLYWPLVCYRFDFFMRILADDPSQRGFAHGWANRMKEFWDV